ncbi:Pr2TM family membrane protein [Thalassotalea sp. M1531]|uniref:Pr2TM family membrane protein n=1 Tax=Thalassotalea algicola TaxID=2716224 RepID=A0A7Y0Q6D3_9GAMM|nr:2TM domain-containing protein [Thalassotalea algicola]NMP30707.1 Pr2TM family membrane protein [Thalassotalea algicola]
MIVKKLRLKRGWSQEQLSQLSGLSVRTIQRIERGQTAGLESLKSLAAVFEVELNILQQETSEMTTSSDNLAVTLEEKRAMEYVQGLKDFYGHLAAYIIVIPALIALNLFLTPQYQWFWFPMLGWGVGLAIHAATTFQIFSLFDAEWEKKQIEKRLGRRL